MNRSLSPCHPQSAAIAACPFPDNRTERQSGQPLGLCWTDVIHLPCVYVLGSLAGRQNVRIQSRIHYEAATSGYLLHLAELAPPWLTLSVIRRDPLFPELHSEVYDTGRCVGPVLCSRSGSQTDWEVDGKQPIPPRPTRSQQQNMTRCRFSHTPNICRQQPRVRRESDRVGQVELDRGVIGLRQPAAKKIQKSEITSHGRAIQWVVMTCLLGTNTSAVNEERREILIPDPYSRLVSSLPRPVHRYSRKNFPRAKISRL